MSRGRKPKAAAQAVNAENTQQQTSSIAHATADKERVILYFDKQRFTLKLRQYHAVLEFAKDVLREIKKYGIYPENELIRGLMQVREVAIPVIKDKSKELGVKTIPFSIIELQATESAESVINAFITDNVNYQPLTRKEAVKAELEELKAKLLQTCFDIRKRYTQGARSGIFEDVDFNCIEYKESDKEIFLNPDVLSQEKAACNVYAESERVENIYKSVHRIAQELTDIAQNIYHPMQILDIFEINERTGAVEITDDLNFNIL